MIKISRFITRLRDLNEGVAATEFALVILPLMMMLLGGMDLAHQAFVKAQLEGALSDSARRAAVEDPVFTATGNTLEERIRSTVKSQVDPIAPNADYDVSIKNFYDFSGVGNPEKLMTDVNANGTYDAKHNDCFEDLNDNGSYDLDAGRRGVGGANDVVFYRVKIRMPRLFPSVAFFSVSDTINLQASATVRNQPYDEQVAPPVLCGV